MKEKTKLPLILVVALPVLLIISTELARTNFNLIGETFYIVNFIFPLTFLVSGLITKKTQSKNAITLVILSLVIESLVFVLKWIFFNKVDYPLMEVTLFAFFLSQLIFLLGYEVLKEMKKEHKFEAVLLLLLLATLIETMFYFIVFTDITLSSIIISIVVKVIYDLIMAVILAK